MLTRCAQCRELVLDERLVEPPDGVCSGLICLECDERITTAMIGEELPPYDASTIRSANPWVFL